MVSAMTFERAEQIHGKFQTPGPGPKASEVILKKRRVI